MSSSPTQSVHSHSRPSSEKGKQRGASITPTSPTSHECVAAVQSLSSECFTTVSGTAANGEQVHTVTPVSGTTAHGEQVGTTLADWVNTASPASNESTPTSTINTTNGNSTPSPKDANNPVNNVSHSTGNNPRGTPNATNNPPATTVSPVSTSPPELPGGHAPNPHHRPLVITYVNPQGVAMGRTAVVSQTIPNVVQPHPAPYTMHAGAAAQVAAGGQYQRHPQARAHTRSHAHTHAHAQAQAQAQAATHQAVPSNPHHAVRRQAPSASAPQVGTSRLTAELNIEHSLAVTSGMYDVLDVKLRTNSAHLGHLFQCANNLKSHVDSLNEQLRQATIYKDQLGPSDEVTTKFKNITDKLDQLTRQCERQEAALCAHASAATAQIERSSGLHSLISAVVTDVSSLRQELNGLHGGCREQFQVLSGLTPSFHKLDQRVNDVDQRVTDADKRVNDIEFSTQCNEKSLDDAHREVSDLQTSFAKVQKNLTDLADRFESLKPDVNTTELNSDDAASDARKAKEAIEPLRVDIVAVQEELKRAQENFSQLQATVTHLQDEVTQAKNRVTQVEEHHLVQVQKDNSQTRQDLEKVRGQVNHFRDEPDKIRKLIASVETKVNKRVTAIEHQMVDHEIAQRNGLDVPELYSTLHSMLYSRHVSRPSEWPLVHRYTVVADGTVSKLAESSRLG